MCQIIRRIEEILQKTAGFDEILAVTDSKVSEEKHIYVHIHKLLFILE